MPHRDYYEVLGVGKTADAGRIRQAYRRLARKHHPDVNPGDQSAAERFREIGEAYDVLSDPAKRRRYDAGGRPGQPRAGPFPQGGGWSFVGDLAGRGARSAGGPGLSDIFSRLFAGGAPFARGAGTAAPPWAGSAPGGARPRKAPDPETTVEVRLEEVLSGALRSVTTGSGASFRVRIPPGVTDGARLRLPTPEGPAQIRVRIAEHPQFRRRGQDLETDVPVSFDHAVLGGEIEVATLEGPVKVRLPPGTSSGAGLRIRGHGLPRRPPGSGGGSEAERGDLVARVRITVPDDLTPEQREALRSFSRAKASKSD